MRIRLSTGQVCWNCEDISHGGAQAGPPAASAMPLSCEAKSAGIVRTQATGMPGMATGASVMPLSCEAFPLRASPGGSSFQRGASTPAHGCAKP